MSEEPRPDDAPERIDFDWQSPRWRETDDDQAVTERGHRFRDETSPSQRGAIDRGDSVPSNAGDAPRDRPEGVPAKPGERRREPRRRRPKPSGPS